jgi:hypothetical protein
MRILLGYSYYRYSVDIKSWVEAWLSRLRAKGIDVDGFCLTLNPPGPCLGWRELDARWHRGDRELLSLYENLAHRLEGYDVFVNWNGINLHPEFVEQLSTFSVYGCFDDPESSDDLSRPVAWAYDLCMVGNIAELDTYRSWGVREVRHWPNGFRADDYDPSLTRDDILNGKRDVDVAMFCERQSPWRQERLDRFAARFPQGAYYGRGWPNGFLPEEQRVPLLQRTKIGINLHNSTGPINFRTFYLPANGVLQICDNKKHLGHLFDLDKEAVGYDTMDEAIHLCQYYLSHDEKRREIAAAGWERALRDYNEVETFKLVEKYVAELLPMSNRQADDALGVLRVQRERTAVPRVLFDILYPWRKLRRLMRSILSRLRRHLLRA